MPRTSAQKAAAEPDVEAPLITMPAPDVKNFPSAIAAPIADSGGDVPIDVNDGQHQVAILQDGEKVLTPEEADSYRAQQSTMKPLGAPQSKPSIGRIEPSTSESTEQLIPSRGTPQENAAIAADKKQAMGQGPNGFVKLGTALIHERHLEPSTSDVTGPIADNSSAAPRPGYRPIVTDTTTAPAAPALTPVGHKATIANYDKQIQAALDEATPEGQEKADRLTAAKQNYIKNTPWGSAENHPGILGKIGHVAERIAARTPGLAPIIATLPGSETMRAAEEQSAYGRILPDTEAEEKAAQTAKAQAELKAGPAEKPAEYEIKSDDQGRMWRVDKLSKQPPQLITFDKSGAPTLSAAPAGVQPPAFEQPTFGKKTEKGMDAPANETQQSEFTAQLATIAPALSSDERSTFAFPAGYKPTLKEIEDNKKLLREANSTKLAGKREDLANQTAQAASNKRTQEEKMVEQIAKDIAPMDVNSLSQLKTITSMRSDQRSLIYARAKELNPEFNTAEVDRKVKMLDNFTNGKDGQSLQSFGTFLEHAGDANQVVQNIRNGVTPQILNVPLNALEKHGWGTTATQLSAALEPVRKEFEGFLLGGRALYAEDRKAAETILSDSSTPAQVQAALKQMAHTVSARYNEMDNRFKNTMKVDISEGVGPLSDSAFNGAEAIGVKELGGKTLRDGKHGYGWYNTSTEEK